VINVIDRLKKLFADALQKTADKIRGKRSADMVQDVAFRPARATTAHDKHLIERSVTHWQFGDWASLLLIKQETIEQHPDRAKLALLVATANAQQGFTDVAREYAAMAKNWGCPREIIARILVAGTYNSVARAAALANDDELTRALFRLSMNAGAAGGVVDMMIHARIDEQYRQLGLPIVESYRESAPPSNACSANDIATSLEESHVDPCAISNDEIQELADAMIATFSDSNIAEHDFILNRISEVLRKNIDEKYNVKADFTTIEYGNEKIKFVYASNDYIPEKIKKEGKFYESIFLESLSKLHKENGLIIDVGANIGNHTIFFGKVLHAEVIAIEPEPHNAFFLDLNVRLNKLQNNVKVLKTAVGKAKGMVRIEMNVVNNFGSFTAKPEVNPNSSTVVDAMAIEVETQTIDYLVSNNNRSARNVSIIKIDVEGMEVEALLGAESVIRQSLPVIAVECFRHEDLLSIEKILGKYAYFSIEVVNATPTFIFISKENPYHLNRFEYQLRAISINKAAKYKGFIAA